jgi:hypothetical protein
MQNKLHDNWESHYQSSCRLVPEQQSLDKELSTSYYQSGNTEIGSQYKRSH